jgi:hypothetical protein
VTTKCLFLAALLLAGVLACRPAEPPPPAPPWVPEASTPSAPMQETDSQSAAAAALVIREYYEAINRKDYERAFRRWGGGGAASGKTYETFVRGFSGTESVTVDVGSPSPIEGAAGSRYVTVPVEILATAADGATPEERAWQIDSAQIRVEEGF